MTRFVILGTAPIRVVDGSSLIKPVGLVRAKFAGQRLEQDARGHGHVQRAGARAHRDRDDPPAPCQPIRLDSLVFVAQDQADPIRPGRTVEWLGGRVGHRADQDELVISSQVVDRLVRVARR